MIIGCADICVLCVGATAAGMVNDEAGVGGAGTAIDIFAINGGVLTAGGLTAGALSTVVLARGIEVVVCGKDRDGFATLSFLMGVGTITPGFGNDGAVCVVIFGGAIVCLAVLACAAF